MPNKYQDSFFDEPAKPKAAPKQKSKPAFPDRSAATPAPPPVFVEREISTDRAFEAAMRNLEPVLHPEVIAEYPHIFDPYHNKGQLSERVEDWRERHGFLDGRED